LSTNLSQTAGPKLRVSRRVLDASALLALIFEEPGADIVRQAVNEGAVVGTVNFAEVVAQLADKGNAQAQISALLAPIRLEVVNFDADHAWRAGFLREGTKSAGLSFGDRACLALGLVSGLPVLTADRIWAQLDLGVEVVLCR
jgi:PIN domain nuclease of toxin-antitoxin system